MFAGGDTNLYGYVFNDPVNYIDVNGERGVLLIARLLFLATSYLGLDKIDKANQQRPVKVSVPQRNSTPATNASLLLQSGVKYLWNQKGSNIESSTGQKFYNCVPNASGSISNCLQTLEFSCAQ